MLAKRLNLIRLRSPSFCLVMCSVMPGCSSLNTYLNREIQENQIEADRSGYRGSIMGMTAARRGVVIRATSEAEIAGGRPQLVFCAEPPPDAIQSINSAFEASLKDEAAEARASDTYSTAVAGIAARTPISETYRTAVFSLCQLNINGSIDNTRTADLFESITKDAFEALKTAAGKEPVAPAANAAASGPVADGKKTPTPEPGKK